MIVPAKRRMRRSLYFATHVAALAFALAMPAPAAANHSVPVKSGAHAAPARPNILLITLDTTRADRMGFLSSERGLTPNLDALAKESAVFTHAYAQAPLTPTSHATILTGTYPQFHQVNNFRVPLAKDLPYAPDILHAHGYHTAAFVGSMALDPNPRYAPGFDRGFDTYDANFQPLHQGDDRYQTIERRGAVVVAHATEWLARHPKGPFFIWVHLYDPHDPYDPPEPYKSRFASEPYDGEIAYADAALGKLFRQLKLSGHYQNTVIAVMADHGESLGQHGEDTHGTFLYDETIQVPLVVKLPRGTAEKSLEKRIENRVELVDVLPTLLESVGVAVPSDVQGKSLLGLINGDAGDAATRDKPAYAETDYPRFAYGWSGERSLRSGKYLYVQVPHRELYDQATDPNAERNLAAQSPAVADTLASQLKDFREKTASKGEAPQAALDSSAQASLAALGYLSAGNDSPAGASAQGPDPKDKIQIGNLARRASLDQEEGRFEEAAKLLQEVVAREPDMRVYGALGDCFMNLKEYQKAVPVLRKAMEMDRESPRTHFALAKALMRSRDFEGAIPELEITEAKMPELADVHFLLQAAYMQTNRVQEVLRESNIILQFAPDHYPTYLILGRFLDVSGDVNGAISSLKKAMALEPKAPDAHAMLADIYDKMGRKTDAARERSAAKRLGGIPAEPADPAPNAGKAGKH